ncbi:MAG: YggT family protein [Anaerolineae bacterium]
MSYLGVFLSAVLGVLQWAIIIRVLLSWLPMAGIRIDPYNPIIKILLDITDPILNPLRRFTTIGMIDLSPIVALLLISFIRQALVVL